MGGEGAELLDEGALTLRLNVMLSGGSDDLLEEFNARGIDYCRFGYTANQGLFELVLPKLRCNLIEKDSTIENLACLIAKTLHQEHPGSRFWVKAFEGVDKGAFGEA